MALKLYEDVDSSQGINVEVQPVKDNEGFMRFIFPAPINAAKLTLTFTNLIAEHGSCYVSVDEVKAFTGKIITFFLWSNLHLYTSLKKSKPVEITMNDIAITGSYIIAAIPPWAIALIVFTVLVLIGGGVLLFLRQRELAHRMGVRVPLTDGAEMKSISQH
jgi:hypothetical protein